MSGKSKLAARGGGFIIRQVDHLLRRPRALAHGADEAAERAATRRAARPRHAPRRPTPTDNAKEHLTPRDLDAARRELNGEVVARKADGTPWDHVTEVRQTQRALTKRIGVLKRQLGSDLSAAERAAVQRELGEASRLLDHSRKYVP